jgi:RimJ/RimL family protein N-acetyltransferase
MLPFNLDGEGLRLDQPVQADIAVIAEYCKDPVFEQYLTTPWPYTLDDARYFVDQHVPQGWRGGYESTWAIRSATADELLGVIGYRTAHNDIGFWLGAPHRGKGIMPSAVRLVTAKLFDSRATTQVTWECVVGNLASLSVARTCGFTYTGVGPAHTRARDGSYPQSWHAVLQATDTPSHTPGWPDITVSAPPKSLP